MKHLKKIILSVLAAVLLIGGTFFTISASNDIDTTDSEIEATMSPEEEAELDKKNQAVEAKNENDIKALEILRGLNKTQATELIQDKEEDCKLMFEICDMIKNNEFTTEQEQIMKNYLERRLMLLDNYDEETGEENDSALISEIKGVLNYESYN